MARSTALFLALLTGTLFAIGCRPLQPQLPSLPTAAPENRTQLDAFEAELVQALTQRDFAVLPPLMDPLFIIDFGGGLLSLPSTDALGQMRTIHLAAAPVTFVEPDASFAQLLNVDDPYAIWGDGADVVDLLLSRGWTESGFGEGILAIGRRADGSYYWHGLILHPIGFPRVM